jgi:eukaryotic-like serine/threonine-protein kinase
VTHPTEPSSPAADSTWGLGRGDLLSPGRRAIRRLGEGGAHEAYLVDVGDGLRAVAKLPRPCLAQDLHCLAALSREGRALRRLASPAVPRHLDTVLAGPRPHLLMEYVPGPTLRTAIAAHGPLATGVVATLGCELACALATIADAGWVHLDVKPSNVLLNARPRLLDFELARPAAEARRITVPTGTWQYMPPEQRAAGTGAEPLGPAADVFGLALTLCEALAGRPIERLPAPAPPRGDLGSVLADALAAAPCDRPRARELAAALAEWAEGGLDVALVA